MGGGMPTMTPGITMADLPSAGGMGQFMPPPSVNAPPMYIPPVPRAAIPVIDNSLINGAIQNQRTRTTIIISQ
jgi:hypothetical protein